MSHSPAPAALNWGAEALWLALEPLLPGLSVEVVAQMGSTNTELLARARQSPADACKPALLVAEQQTAGRGRQGKAWQSAVGASLTFSLALPLALADWSGLSLAVGLALAEALDPAPTPAQNPTGAVRLGLKWPNDLILLDQHGQAPHIGRKLGGILIETVQAGSQRIAVIGIGLNIRPLAPGAVPLVQGLQAFERQGFAPLQPAFAQRDVLAGRLVTTSLPGLPLGRADGVDGTGTLWLQTADGRRPVASGEVSLKPAGAAPC